MKTNSIKINRHLHRATLLLGAVLSLSCAQTIPPRTYDPKVAAHLRNLSHDAPVTPIPASYGWGYWGHGYWACY